MDEKMQDSSIRIGVMPPLSGLVGIYGPEISWAARIAVDQINHAGGLLGRRLELIIEDDGSLPETAVPAAKRLVEERGCVAIIGNLLSNSRIAVAAEVAEPLRIPYLNFSFYEGSITGRYFFHFAALPNQQIDKMIPFMARHYGLKMYFAGNNYEWPRGSIDAAKRILMRLGGDVVGEQYLPIGASSAEIDTLLSSVARSGADVFVPYFAGDDQILLLNRFSVLGLKNRMAVVMGHYDEVMVSCLNPDVREGFFSSNTYFMSVDTPENRNYLQRLAEQPDVSGIWPNGNGALTNFGEGTYNCVMAFAEAVRRAGTVEAEAVVDALESVRILGPQGEIRMDPATQHAHVNSYLARCNADGTFSIVEEFGRIPPEIPERYRLYDALRTNADSSGTVDPDARNVAEPIPQLGDARRILAIADMAVLATDQQGQIINVNANICELFGYREEEMIGMSVHLLVPPQFRRFHAQMIEAFVQSGAPERRMGQRGSITGYRKDGTFFPMEASIAKFQDGERWVLVATIRDLIQVKRAEEELTWQATHDSLTGLPNRSLILERLNNALERSRRMEQSVALLFIDLDGFKEVNDTYGHDAGDKVLTTFSERLIHQVRPGDTVGRLAGDEFVVLCEQVNDPADIGALAERIAEAARTPMDFNGTHLYVTGSIGIATGHGSTSSSGDLLRHADMAMYAVKQKGRNGWQFFNSGLQEQSQKRLEISSALRFATERKEFRAVFQPIISADAEIIQGAELLTRWRRPGGEISPAEFIPIAEMTGAIIPIGNWVFEEACRAARRWQDEFGDAAPYVAFNLSARQLESENMVEKFQEILGKTGANPDRMVLEITESSLMANVASNRTLLERLAGFGLKIAVDDFGTGYSSLAQLLRLKVNTLKIDREFITDLDSEPDKQAVVAAICRMARALKLKIVAEGVETRFEMDMVRSLGANSIQGYFFSRPLEEQAFVDLFRKNRARSLSTPSRQLQYLIYVSRANSKLSETDISNILDQARRFNLSHAVSGYLLHVNGVFIQYLEGPEEVLRDLFSIISADPRHRDVTRIASGAIRERFFSDWNMGYLRTDHLNLQKLANIEIDPENTFRLYCSNPSLCCDLFDAIRP